ncbi:MAG: glutamyl-tRNA reductase [Acidobacteria bacterium]|nr:MAG: glutamyl-tRNA reductase [Acidobacteriota bacterium]
MSVIVTGLNYQVAEVSVLEQLSFRDEDLPKALAGILQCEHVGEAVILSTCNRVEIYVNASRFHPAAAEIRDFLSEFHHLEPAVFAEQMYTYYDDAAITHLFNVTAGLDSMVLGETEIIGQVRRAFKAAQEEGVIERTLSSVFRRALEVGKRVRTETGISENAASVSSAAVALAGREFGGLSGRDVVVLGAGEAGQAGARALKGAGAATLTVVNRSIDKAIELAGVVGAAAAELSDLDEVVARSDILVCSTRSDDLVLSFERVSKMAEERGHRPLMIIDIAVPRDVDPSAADIEGVTLLDIDGLRSFADEGRKKRATEARRGREIIAGEVTRFLEDEMAARYSGLIAALRKAAEETRADEIARYSGRLADLEHDDLDLVDSLTRSLVNKLLHTPTVRMRELAATADGALLAESLAKLFDLTDEWDAGSDSDA